MSCPDEQDIFISKEGDPGPPTLSAYWTAMATQQTVFATLKPSNLPAKISFDTLAQLLASDPQDVTSKYHCHVAATRIRDREIAHYQQHKLLSCSDNADGNDTATSTELESDVESELVDCGSIWTGLYPFDMARPPREPSAGWIYGRSQDVEFYTPARDNDIRGRHGIFNFDIQTGYIILFSRASITGKHVVTVDGCQISRGKSYLLNKQKMRLGFGRCLYEFEYTPFARTAEFEKQRQKYMSVFLQTPTDKMYSLTPTPSAQTRTLGDWTLCSNLGFGTFGKVYSATNSKGRLVAIKIVDRTSRTAAEVDGETKVLKRLTDLVKAETTDQGSCVLCLLEVIYTAPAGSEIFQGGQFEDVAYVFEQCVPETFEDLLKPVRRDYQRLG
jgi:hypothetical protein